MLYDVQAIVVLAILLAAGVHGQSSSFPSDTASVTSSSPEPRISGITSCMLDCFNIAAVAVGCGEPYTQCICDSPRFQGSATSCLRETCTLEEQYAAVAEEISLQGQCPNASTTNQHLQNGALGGELFGYEWASVLGAVMAGAVVGAALVL